MRTYVMCHEIIRNLVKLKLKQLFVPFQFSRRTRTVAVFQPYMFAYIQLRQDSNKSNEMNTNAKDRGRLAAPLAIGRTSYFVFRFHFQFRMFEYFSNSPFAHLQKTACTNDTLFGTKQTALF